jgi:2-desacetyl-2-hydroxyethyl bacteriochlorophyllide A dehydrogenase
MKRLAVYFTGPREVSVREEPLPTLEPDQVLVETTLSAISPGTELLVYRGEAPAGLVVDETTSSLADSFAFPLQYGYSTVGRVTAKGSDVDASWIDRTVFVFHAHESCFVAHPTELIQIPDHIRAEDAVFLANMETAVNLLMDGAPLIGEQVAVLGQGVVGLLTTALLSHIPLASLVTLDLHSLRRQASLELGAHSSIDPTSEDSVEEALSLLQGPRQYRGADLTYELSGSPSALDQAIAITGYSGRVVIGSWYGQKRSELDLGGRFHRSRIRLLASQVSTLSPEMTGRWTKTRRFWVTWEMLDRIKPSEHCVTHRFPIGDAAAAYQLLDEKPAEAIQALLTY